MPIVPAGSAQGFPLPDNVQQETYRATLYMASINPGLPVRDGLREMRSGLDNVPYLVVSQCVTVDGEPVPPAVAAENVVKLLKDSRSIAADETTPDRQEPLGVIISADVELSGLRGKEVLLNWSMWQAGGDVRLHGEWLNRNLAYRLQPTTHRDTTTVDLWIPLPRPPGPYLVRVEMTTDGIGLDADESELID